MFKAVLDFFNWKKYPHNVFFIAIPLFVTNFFGFLFWIAIQEGMHRKDWVYFYIWIAGLALLLFAMFPVARYFYRLHHEQSVKNEFPEFFTDYGKKE